MKRGPFSSEANLPPFRVSSWSIAISGRTRVQRDQRNPWGPVLTEPAPPCGQTTPLCRSTCSLTFTFTLESSPVPEIEPTSVRRRQVGDLTMAEFSGQRTPSTSSSSDQTRAEHQPVAVPVEKSGFSADHHHITRTVSHKNVPVEYFSGDGELQRQVSRQGTGVSTHTQDPTSDDFDFEKQLRHLLRKADDQGVKRRELGGESTILVASLSFPISADS